ncbi:MAG TPA: lytic transglycosylase domain-containing protein, partial [Xanthobacteraceae bacterium]|nr:lytic transglycosylase domain-containing protein [Xanthobacteraceae bacterium]
LLDAETNMTYAMKYLAGAYRAAGGNPDRAVALYARGYYYEAKKMGFSAYEPPRAAGLAPVTVAR